MEKYDFSNPDYNLRLRDIPFGIQFLFVAFGATVLVPILTGLDPLVTLFTAGLGTLLFQYITKWKVPVFLGSSFAYIPAIAYGVQTWGIPTTMIGLCAAGFVKMGASRIIKYYGIGVIHRIFPPIVIGPVIMIIGLALVPIGGKMSQDLFVESMPIATALWLSMSTLAVMIIWYFFVKGIARHFAILIALAWGYIWSIVLGVVSFVAVAKASWIMVPNFTLFFNFWDVNVWGSAILAVITIIFSAIAPTVEHVGDVFTISGITGRDYVKDPGMHRTMLGDGAATCLASLFGGPPNTTYSEVTGAIALTRIFNPAVMTWAALAAISFAFLGKLGALLGTIPDPVKGGIMMAVFPAIAVVGANVINKSKIDILHPRNIIIGGQAFAFGLSGLAIKVGMMNIEKIALAAIVSIALHLILPGKEVSLSQIDEEG